MGQNGYIVSSIVLLEGVPPIKMCRINAEEGKVLTNGERKVFYTTIPETELEQWTEIDNIEE
jgi:hypothetical protein